MAKEKATGLALLREPFPAHQISKLPKPLKKDAQKGKCTECGGYHGLPAVHLDYVGHAALTDRLLDADPEWTWEPLALGPDGLPQFDKSGGLWIRLTVCGVSRLGYGNAEGKAHMEVGAREKEVIGDALRNAAMRFGAALDLWHKGQLHEDERTQEPPDGYESWVLDMEVVAANGIEGFRKLYKATRKSYRDYIEQNDKPRLDAMVAKAKAVTAAASAAA
jgi:hypothetical protein